MKETVIRISTVALLNWLYIFVHNKKEINVNDFVINMQYGERKTKNIA